MDLGAFGEWWNIYVGVLWDRQQWGTVANWFSAVGTVSAFGLGVWILNRDRKLRRRVLADSFVTWWSTSMSYGSRGTYNNKLQIYGHNASEVPIPHSIIRVRLPNDKIVITSFLEAGDWDIAPKTKVKNELDLDDLSGSECKAAIEFIDGRGKAWYRDIKNNKYLSKRAHARFIRPSSKDKEDLGKYRDPAALKASV